MRKTGWIELSLIRDWMDQSLRAGNVVGVDASLHVASPTCRERHSEFKSNEGPMITPHLVLDPFQWIFEKHLCGLDIFAHEGYFIKYWRFGVLSFGF